MVHAIGKLGPECALLYVRLTVLFFFFFFQAEDGIRDLTVTGVQTCALPIFLDVHLPYLDGLKLLSALREDETTRDLLVVVFSEDDNPTLVEEAKRLSAEIGRAHV